MRLSQQHPSLLRIDHILAAILIAISSAYSGSVLAEPVAMPNQHPQSLVQWSLRPDSARQLSTGTEFVRQSVFWSNTYIRRLRTTVDAETIVSETNYRRAISDGIELDIVLPLAHRGGGVLDSVIKEWDQVIGFANERREAADDDQFRIAGPTRDGERFDWEEDGFSLGNIPLSVRYELASELEFQLTGFTTVQLPTARDSYGLNGFDLATGLLAEVPLNRVISAIGNLSRIHGGASLSYSTDDRLHGIEYARWRSDVFLGSTLQLTDRWDAYLGLVYYSRSVENVSGFPNESLYLDTAVGFAPQPSLRVDIFCRENPLYPSKTTDVTVGMSVKILF